jgi:hypothetical protein
MVEKKNDRVKVDASHFRGNLPESYPERVMAIWQDCDLWGGDGLNWTVGYQDYSINLFVNCNDLFEWACADAEPITKEDMELFEQTAIDLLQLEYDGTCSHATCYLPELYASRKRGMRPQGAWLYGYMRDGKKITYCDEEVVPLFEAAGPERGKSFGNPVGKDAEDLKLVEKK